MTCTSISGEVGGLSPEAQRITFTATPDGATKAAYEKAVDSIRARAKATVGLDVGPTLETFGQLLAEYEKPGQKCLWHEVIAEAEKAFHRLMTHLKAVAMGIVTAQDAPIWQRARALDGVLAEYLKLDRLRSLTGCDIALDSVRDILVEMVRQAVKARDLRDAMKYLEQAQRLGHMGYEEVAAFVQSIADKAFGDMTSEWDTATADKRSKLGGAAIAAEQEANLMNGTDATRAFDWYLAHGGQRNSG